MENVDLSSLRAVINCSEPMKHESHELFFEAFNQYGFQKSALATSYAMAEYTFAVTQGGIDEPVFVEKVDRDALMNDNIAKPEITGKPFVYMVSVGKPILHTKVIILDERGNALSDRYIGEIALQSNCMLTEYYNRPDITEKSFIDGWFLTGDYGYLFDGELFVTGRKKDLVIIGGKNIYPQDLERLAFDVPGVHPGRVVAFGIFSREMGTEQVVMVAETDTDSELERNRIAQEIRKVVAHGSAIVLKKVYIVEKGWIIKTSSGKTARASNRDKFIKETSFVINEY